jgi:L-methionine (R)-S-oxide reductase
MESVLDELRRLGESSLGRRAKARQAADLIRTARSYHWVGLYDVKEAEITAIGWTGSDTPAFPSFARTQGLNGAAVAARAPVIVQDVTRDERYLTTFSATRAEAIFPVATREDGQIVGTIDVESDRTDAFTAEDEAFLRSCAVALAGLWA